MTSRRPLVQPPPAQMNARRIVIGGTVAWFVAFVVLLCCHSWVSRHGHDIWLWTSLAGWLLGIVGETIMIRHRGMGRTI